MTHDDFARIVVAYRRELWLWLAGERTWAQACSGLVGPDQPPPGPGCPRRRVTAATDRSPVIALHDVGVRRDGVVVLDGVDWLVRSGERWVILGPNGSGKTTLLALAGARLWPSAGVVEILGARLGRVDVRTLRPRISLVSGSVTRQLRPDLPARRRGGQWPRRSAGDLVAPVLGGGLGPGRPLAWTRPVSAPSGTAPSA